MTTTEAEAEAESPTTTTTITTTTTTTMAPRPELTLIVAATSSMGIGLKGALPWTGLRMEMAYFARVTRRGFGGGRNAVIMGRKTWDSIPSRFRPLKGRRNLVVSRTWHPSSASPDHDVEIVSSMEDAVMVMGRLPSTDDMGSVELNTTSPKENSTDNFGRAFVIGGAQIYKAALERPETKRILLTRILGDFECDTFFPVVLGEEGVSGPWKRRGENELAVWTGEGEGVGGVKEEGGTKYVFEMWEKEG